VNVSRIVISAAAALAACGVVGMAPPAVQASSASIPTWTQQTPAAHPTARFATAMAYDAANGTVVMFGGAGRHGTLGDTWTWDGTTWTKQHPPVHPSRRSYAVMAYDAANGTVVLFGGAAGRFGRWVGDTWTWNGTTWTRQHPPVHPSARGAAGMAYDAANGTVVLFGGGGSHGTLNDTWTWNGTTWTRQHPATSPPVRDQTQMAYDAANGTVVLYGGNVGGSGGTDLGDTWTWDGTTWTRQHPAASPPTLSYAAMAYDAGTGTVVLFGGEAGLDAQLVNDTWTWNGTTWTQQHPATSPPARALTAMAYDAATSTAVLFGGLSNLGNFADTWTWG
jgi:hypothetical protein